MVQIWWSRGYRADKQVIDTRTDRQTQATTITDGHTGLG